MREAQTEDREKGDTATGEGDCKERTLATRRGYALRRPMLGEGASILRRQGLLVNLAPGRKGRTPIGRLSSSSATHNRTTDEA
jgi:hypothetical protein